MIQKEERQIIVDILMKALEYLKGNDKKILEMFVIDGWNQYEIARQLNISQPAVSQRLQKIPKMLENCLSPRYYILCKELLLDNPSVKEATTPKEHIGWLCSRLQKVNDGGYWGYNSHRKTNEYKTKYKCIIDTYIDALCSQCGTRCSNKIMKERIKCNDTRRNGSPRTKT